MRLCANCSTPSPKAVCPHCHAESPRGVVLGAALLALGLSACAGNKQASDAPAPELSPAEQTEPPAPDDKLTPEEVPAVIYGVPASNPLDEPPAPPVAPETEEEQPHKDEEPAPVDQDETEPAAPEKTTPPEQTTPPEEVRALYGVPSSAHLQPISPPEE